MSPPRGYTPLIVVLLVAAVALAAAEAFRRWLDVVEVRGHSMSPALDPGDRLLVESWSFTRRNPRPGDMVLARDPRQPRRELVKRVGSVDAGAGSLELRGDAPAASTDSRAFGAVPIAAVRWRVVGRYWPLARPQPPHNAATASTHSA